MRRILAVLVAWTILILLPACKDEPTGKPLTTDPAGATATAVTTISGDPVIAAAGDIACDPDSAYFSGISSKYCQDKKTADLVREIDPDKVIALGDLQYSNGELSEFQKSYSRSWGQPDIKDKTLPIVGNHEYNTSNAQGFRDYFDKSDPDLSTSVKIGDWRVFLLNSNCTKVNCTSIANWMKKTMSEKPTACTLAAWHHPYRTDVANHYPGQSASKVFEDVIYGNRGEVVLNGHAHSLEISNKITPSGTKSTRGIKHFTVGSGGKESYKAWKHSTKPSWTDYRINSKHAVLKMTLHPSSYDYQLIATDGSVLRSGTRNCV
jgi:hypothetical protein